MTRAGTHPLSAGRRALVAALLGLVLLPASQAQDTGLLLAPPALFQPADDFAAASALPPALAGSRQRAVELAPEILAQLQDGRLKWARLPFFDDTPVDVVFTGIEKWGDSVIVQGKILGHPMSTATLVSHKGCVTANIEVPNQPRRRLTSIPGDPAGATAAVAIEDAAMPGARCGNSPLQDRPDPTPVAGAAAGGGGGIFEPASATETWVDIAVFYTDVARQTYGGVAQIESHILIVHSIANSAHSSSDTRARLRLVHLAEIAYNESGTLDDHLDRLTEENDGYMDSVHAVRDSLGADLVHLFLADSGTADNSSTIGLAWTPGEFGVTQIGHTYVYAHEVGHNLGCRHELIYTNVPPTNYNHAREIVESWDLVLETCEQRVRTVMWSSSGNIVPYFSNPNRTYTMGADFCCGNPESFCTDEVRPLGVNSNYFFGFGIWADNARYLRENRSTRAGHRQPVFYVQAGASDGEATQRSPENDLPEVFSEWFPKTEVNPAQAAVIRLRPGIYPGSTRLAQKARLEKWDGSGNARLTP